MVDCFLSIVVLKEPLPNILSIGFGLVLVLVILGLTFFIFGLEMGLFPIGESIGASFCEKRQCVLVDWFLRFVLVLVLTIAEPALTGGR
ncbi:DUF1538 family protein [Vibrio sp. 03_296]|uniref:DUF1538 family protein n=1 Tax=Vibrio sp. 03_296 TaxID=2024409 RepID=UPI0034E83D66